MNSSQINNLWQQLDAGSHAAVLESLPDPASLPPAARMLRGICHLEAREWPAAREDFDAVLAAQPDNSAARLHRALALYRLGEPRAAARDFRAGPIFPEQQYLRRFLRTFWPVRFEDRRIAAAGMGGGALPPALAEAVETHRSSGEQPGSRSAVQLARKLNRHGVKAYVAKRRAEAAAAFEVAAEIDPAQAEHAMFHAWCLLQSGEGERAREIVEPLVERSLEEYLAERPPGGVAHPHLICEYAWALHECGEHRGALALLSTVRPAGPDDYWAHIIAALCWTMLGETEKADACFDGAFGGFFLETWDQFVQPFMESVIIWLESEAPEGGSGS